MFKVIVTGLRGEQFRHLQGRLPDTIRLRQVRLGQLIRTRSMRPDLVLCTRFIAHKHTLHLQSILGTHVIVCTGGIGAWANEILSHMERVLVGTIYGRAC